MRRTPDHLGLAVVLCVLGLGFWTASALADSVVLCRTWTGYVKARYGSCAWGEAEIPLTEESPKTFFVTSANFPNADLVTWANVDYDCDVKDGLDAGNCICQRLADASDMVPGATYKAWLSVSGDLPRSPSTSWAHPDGPYMRVDGILIANNYADLVDGKLIASPNVDESGNEQARENVWTGTSEDGKPTGKDCNGWTASNTPFGSYGLDQSTESGWTNQEIIPCSAPGFRLYCAEQR
jgi:hypothetical protein